MSFLSTILKFFGNKSKRDMRELSPVVNKVLVFSNDLQSVSNDDLRKKTIDFKKKISQSVDVFDQQVLEIKKQIANEKNKDLQENLYKEIDRVNSGMDIICLTSLNEGTPVSLIEAQASGKPIVSTKTGGIKNIVLDLKFMIKTLLIKVNI